MRVGFYLLSALATSLLLTACDAADRRPSERQLRGLIDADLANSSRSHYCLDLRTDGGLTPDAQAAAIELGWITSDRSKGSAQSSGVSVDSYQVTDLGARHLVDGICFPQGAYRSGLSYLEVERVPQDYWVRFRIRHVVVGSILSVTGPHELQGQSWIGVLYESRVAETNELGRHLFPEVDSGAATANGRAALAKQAALWFENGKWVVAGSG